MYPLGRPVDDVDSPLADFARSAWDAEHVGKRSEPYRIAVEAGALEKVDYASGIHLGSNGSGAPIASHAYFWTLINNTPTYRKYEQYVQHGVEAGSAHVHTGDDYRYLRPIPAGETIAVTCEITRRYEKPGRQGRMVFIEDMWSFHDERGELAGDLVRKAVTVYYDGGESKPRYDIVAVPDVAVARAGALPEIEPARLELGRPTHAAQYDAVSLTMMVQWMGAVDDYARTHYDPAYAAERGFPGGKPLVAGPHGGALMLGPLAQALGPRWWIERFDHLQRHVIVPDELLRTFGRVTRLHDDGGGIELELFLVDAEDRVRHSGVAVVRRRG